VSRGSAPGSGRHVAWWKTGRESPRCRAGWGGEVGAPDPGAPNRCRGDGHVAAVAHGRPLLRAGEAEVVEADMHDVARALVGGFDVEDAEVPGLVDDDRGA